MLVLCPWDAAAKFITTNPLTLSEIKQLTKSQIFWHSRLCGVHCWQSRARVLSFFSNSKGDFIEIETDVFGKVKYEINLSKFEDTTESRFGVSLFMERFSLRPSPLENLNLSKSAYKRVALMGAVYDQDLLDVYVYEDYIKEISKANKYFYLDKYTQYVYTKEERELEGRCFYEVSQEVIWKDHLANIVDRLFLDNNNIGYEIYYSDDSGGYYKIVEEKELKKE